MWSPNSSKPPVMLIFRHYVFLLESIIKRLFNTPMLGSITYLTIKCHKTMEEKRGKGTKPRKGKTSSSPLVQLCSCQGADPQVPLQPHCALPSLSCFPGNYTATEEESLSTERNKDCCSPLTPPPLHHFWIIKSGTAIARLESSSIIMATQMFTAHLLSECQDTRDQVCQMDTGEATAMRSLAPQHKKQLIW